MSITTCPSPSNLNPLSPNGFKFSVTKLPGIDFFCQEITLPELSLGTAIYATPLSDQPIPGDKIEFGDLTIKFIINSDMSNYKAIYDLIMGLGFPIDHEQYKAWVKKDTRNITSELMTNLSNGALTILNNQNNPAVTIQFSDMYPVLLSSLTFSTTNNTVQFLTGEATFKYGWYEIV